MAAGLGFKTFTVGEVLTAADTNGYLMQGVLVFTDAAARDAAITAPAEGQFAYTKDTNGLWYYDGAAWVASGATGDIEGVTAGVGITGGGTSGTVTVTNSMATAITTAGDLIKGTGSGTFDRLGIGATGDVLTVAAGTASWAAPAGGTTSYTLINTGGTAFSGAGTTLTVSSLSGYNKLFVSIYNASSSIGLATFTFRLNADTSSNYDSMGGYVYNPLSFNTHMVNGEATLAGTSAPLGYPSGAASSVVNGGIIIDGANSTSVKVFDVSTIGDYAGNDTQRMISFRGQYKGTSVISSISFITSVGTWDAGTVYIYGAN